MMGTLIQIKTDNPLAFVSCNMKQTFTYYNIKHITWISYNLIGQAIVERSNCTLKEMLAKQKGDMKTQRTYCKILY